MRYVIDYSAPPALDLFTPASRAELLAIREDLVSSCASSEHSADALASDIRACDQALAASRAYVARDDDGVYFAVDWWEATPGSAGVAGVCRERLSAVESYIDAPGRLPFDADTIPAWVALEAVGPWTDGLGGWAGSGPDGEFTLADCIEMAELCAAYYRNGIE